MMQYWGFDLGDGESAVARGGSGEIKAWFRAARNKRGKALPGEKGGKKGRAPPKTPPKEKGGAPPPGFCGVFFFFIKKKKIFFFFF